MINAIFLGNLTADAKTRDTKGDYKAISFSLGINEKRQNGNDASTFINCTYWSKSDKIAQYLTKGKKILVVADWFDVTEKDGKTYTNFRVRDIKFADSTKKTDEPTPKANDLLDDDDNDGLPF